MVEDIELKDFPRASGVYKLIWNGSVIYIGSSNDLHRRMCNHRQCIKQGSDHGKKKGFYLFLQNNHFTVEFELTDTYLQKEQELIEYYDPIYNQHRAFTGCGTAKGRDVEYQKDYRQKFREEKKQYDKQYYESHRDEMKLYQKQYQKQYKNQLCNFNGEILKLHALAVRFLRQGIKHPTQEAKKYLIQ